MNYYAKIIKQDETFLVSFPDWPNILTYGDTLDDALHNAGEALNGSIESDFERNFDIPKPTVKKAKNLYPVKVLPHISLAIQLRQLRANRSQTEIASELGISYQAYQKLENPRKCNPTIKTLEKIFSVFKKDFDLIID